MFRINSQVTREDTVRARLPETAYVAQLDENGEALHIDNILVDAPQILDRRFLCDTRLCVRSKGRKGKCRGSCCTDLEVDVTPNEVRQIKRLARRYLDSPQAASGSPEHKAARRILNSDDWLELSYRDEPCLGHHKNKVCALGFLAEDGRLLCAVNAMALALGEPVAKWKLMTCYVFPLHYVEYKDDHYLLTVINKKNYEHMEGCAEVGKLGCIRRPPPEAPRAYEALRDEIEHLLGKRFYRRLTAAAAERNGRDQEEWGTR